MIKIFVNNDISPELIEPQFASLKKYLEEDFQYTICGGESVARKPDKAKKVVEVCRSLGISIIPIDRNQRVMSHCEEFGSPRPRNKDEQIFDDGGRYKNNIQASYATQWTWEEVISKQQGFVAFLHSDVFLMEPLRISDYLGTYDLCSCVISKVQTDEFGGQRGTVVHNPLTHLRHLWEPIMFLNMAQLPEPETMRWWGGTIERTWMPDGGGTYYYLKAHPGIRILEIQPSGSNDDPTVDFHPSRYQFFTIEGKKILHYMAGCRWATDQWTWSGGTLTMSDEEYHAKKLAWVRKLVGV